MKKFATIFCLTIMMCSFLSLKPVAADIEIYTDRPAWEAAVSGMYSEENFNLIEANTEVPGPYPDMLDFADFSMGRLGDQIATANVIYVPPFSAPPVILKLDESPYFRGAVKENETRVRLIFNNPVFAWGANFNAANDGPGLDFFLGNQLNWTTDPDFQTVSIAPSATPGTGFFGFVSTNPFTHLVMSADSGQGFGMDDLVTAFVQQPVTIDDIIDFFEEKVAAGELVGRGYTQRNADRRLHSMRKQLLVISCFTHSDLIADAYKRARFAYKLCDGKRRWFPDLVEDGDEAPGTTAELAAMLLELLDSMEIMLEDDSDLSED